MTYIYLGDRLTDPTLRGAHCSAVRRWVHVREHRDKQLRCITGGSKMLVQFTHERRPRVVLRRLLRKAEP